MTQLRISKPRRVKLWSCTRESLAKTLTSPPDQKILTIQTCNYMVIKTVLYDMAHQSGPYMAENSTFVGRERTIRHALYSLSPGQCILFSCFVSYDCSIKMGGVPSHPTNLHSANLQHRPLDKEMVVAPNSVANFVCQGLLCVFQCECFFRFHAGIAQGLVTKQLYDARFHERSDVWEC